MRWYRIFREWLRASESGCLRVAFNTIVAICVVMVIGLIVEWYVTGGEDVREAVAILHQVPRIVWIVSGVFAFYMGILFLACRGGKFLHDCDKDMEQISRGRRKGAQNSHQ